MENVECSVVATKKGATRFILLLVGNDSNHHGSPFKGCVNEGRVGSVSPAELVSLCGKAKRSVSHGK